MVKYDKYLVSGHCPECGAEIYVEYIRPTFVYSINSEKGMFVDESNLIDNENYLNFICSEDREHDLESPELDRWKDYVQTRFYDRIATHII